MSMSLTPLEVFERVRGVKRAIKKMLAVTKLKARCTRLYRSTLYSSVVVEEGAGAIQLYFVDPKGRHTSILCIAVGPYIIEVRTSSLHGFGVPSLTKRSYKAVKSVVECVGRQAGMCMGYTDSIDIRCVSLSPTHRVMRDFRYSEELKDI